MRIVRRPPSISVFCTSATASRMKTERVADDLDLGAGRQLRPQLVDRRADPVDDADRVRLGLLGDVDRHRRLAVDERQRALLLDACPRSSATSAEPDRLGRRGGR